MQVCRDRGARRPWAALRGAVSTSAAVCEVIAKEIGDPLEEVTPESRLAEELGLDFFDLAELCRGTRIDVFRPDSRQCASLFQIGS